jgi:hypothetical protein
VVTRTYYETIWKQASESLVHITDAGKCRGPVIIAGSGHYTPSDQPEIVATELSDLLGRIAGTKLELAQLS